MQATGGASVGERPRQILLGVGAVVCGLDQATKALAVAALEDGQSRPVIEGVLHWTLHRNPGAAFGIFPEYPIVFTVLAAGVAAAIILLSRRVRGPWAGLGLGLILGGAAGNLIDRVARSPGFLRGEVVDFIDLRVWPAFNVADSGIVVGAALMILLELRQARRAPGPRDGGRS